MSFRCASFPFDDFFSAGPHRFYFLGQTEADGVLLNFTNCESDMSGTEGSWVKGQLEETHSKINARALKNREHFAIDFNTILSRIGYVRYDNSLLGFLNFQHRYCRRTILYIYLKT